jgi:transposase
LPDQNDYTRPSNDLPAVHLRRDVVDFRKGINGPAVLVEETLQLDPFSEQLFVFCNRTRDKVKILYWECNDFCLWQKRLERARFQWPRKVESDVITASPEIRGIPRLVRSRENERAIGCIA